MKNKGPVNKVSDLLSNFTLDGSAIVYEPSEDEQSAEETIKTFVVGGPEICEVDNPNQPRMVFETENGADSADALEKAINRAERIQWDDQDLLFFFQQFEIKLAAVGARKQFTKFQALASVIPKKVIDQVKPLLRKTEAEYTDNNAYLLLKKEVLRIFGPKPEAAMERALGRVLVDKPSELARALVDDMCKLGLECPCCPANVLALWKRNLSSNVRAGIAHTTFNKANFDSIVQLADDIHESHKATAAVAAVSLNETQPAIPYASVPEVAAAARGGGGRGNRGFRGGRGNRGGRGGNQSQRGGQNQGGQQRGTRHPDLPAGESGFCSMHFRWGRSAFFCSDPGSCPWKDVFASKNKNK